jgi:hypothetical protein
VPHLLTTPDRTARVRPSRPARPPKAHWTSFDNTVRNVLWLPTSRRAKYLAKQASDTFFVRAGDVSSAALVFFDVRQLGIPVRAIAVINVMLVSAWFLLARAILKEHGRLAPGEYNNVKSGTAAQTSAQGSSRGSPILVTMSNRKRRVSTASTVVSRGMTRNRAVSR